MSNTIRIKKRAASGSAGAPSSLSPSELAFNEADLKLYYGFGDNGSTPPSASSIITVGGAGAFFNKTDTKDANRILAGPTSGSAAAPTFRALVAADIPSLAHTKISDFDTGVQANRVDQLASATNPVTGVTPTADAHFATKSYVDGVSQGLDVKQSVKVGTTANITLSGTQTIDGVAVSADERVLVKNQSTASENGLYLCKASTWARTDDLAAGVDAAGAFAFVEQGTVNADNAFVCTSNKGSAVVGTNNLVFTQFSGAGQITAGDGLDKSANTLSLDLKSNGGLVIESTELALDLAASSITGTLPATKITSLTSTVTELNVLDGITSTTAELNLMDGGTSATATTLAAADRFVCNDAGTMKQVALSSLVTFLEDESASAFNIDGGTY
nr:phage-related tail fiber protein [uncultured Mediterranean phage uvMED]